VNREWEIVQHSNNCEMPCSTVAGAINDGGEVGSGVVEAAIKKRVLAVH
jgi:hypothetical protein